MASDMDATVSAAERSPLMRRLTLTVILASALATCLAFAATQPILPMLAAHFGGLNAVRMSQLVQTTPGLGLLLGGLLGGWLMAKTGKRPMILASLAAIGVFGVSGAFVSDPWLFLGSRLLLGLASALLSTACVTLMAEIYHGDARAKVMAALQSAGTFSAILIVPIAGFVAEKFGWRAPFWSFAIFAAPVLLIAMFSIPGKGGTPAAMQEQGGESALNAALKLWPYLLLVFCFSELMTMGITQLPFLLKEEGESGAGFQSLVLAGNALLMGVGAALAAPIMIRLGEQKTVLIGLVIAGVGDIVAGWPAPGFIYTSAGSIFSYLGCGVLLTLGFSLVLNRASAEARGLVAGFILAASFIGQFTNAFILAPIIAQIGLHGVYVLVGVLAVLAPIVGQTITRLPPARRALKFTSTHH